MCARLRESRQAGMQPALYFMPASTHPDVAVEFRDVSYRLDHGGTLLHGLNLGVRRGELLVLLGRSGSGKTTTLKLVNRLLDPSSGQVLVEGRPSTQWDPIQLRRHIGYAIQEVGLFPHFTVEGNIGLVPSLEGWPQERIQQRVRELLQLVGLEPKIAARRPRQLSGGQRQRVGVARALAADPPILLMDEPFGALDEMTRERMNIELLKIWSKTNTTVIFVTHSIQEAVYLSSRVAVMSARPGQIISDIAIPLPRPRGPETRDTEQFFHLVSEVRAGLHA